MIKRTILLILFTSTLFNIQGAVIEPDTLTTHELDEVVIKGEKPLINSKEGNLSYDLLNTVRDKPVSNIYEALAYLPGVRNNNGVYELTGTNGVSILLNGELTNMPLQNLYQLLYSTPIERLKNVEIMFAAPAKYHVSGAVINIILKTPKPIDGLTGQFSSGYNQAYYASYNAGLAANYAIKDWTFDLNWTIGLNNRRNHQETYSNHLIDGARKMIEDDMVQKGDNISNVIYASASYKRVKLTYNGQIVSDAHASSYSKGTFGEFINRYNYSQPTNYHNILMRYESPFGLSVGGDFTIYSEKRNQQLTKDDEQLIEAINHQSINKYHVYIDQEHSFNKWKLNYGFEYQHSDDKSKQTYLYPPQSGFNETLRENVADGYIGVQTSLSFGLSFNASAKTEYFNNNYLHNWNFIPQLGATYYKTPKSIFQLSLMAQRVYPQFWELHGGTNYINDYAYIIGNPKLQPYINYSSQLSYILKQKYSATLYFLFADKYSVQLPYQMTDALNLVFQTLNLDFSRTVGLQLQAPFNVGNVLNSIPVVNVSHKQEKATHFHDLSFDNKRWSFYGALNNSFIFSQRCPVSISLDFAYITGQIQGPGRFNSFWKVDAGAKWSFGRKRCCELNLKFNDIFNTWNPKLYINYANQDYKMILHDMTRNFNLSFIWKFNGFKPQKTSIDTSRFGTGN